MALSSPLRTWKLRLFKMRSWLKLLLRSCTLSMVISSATGFWRRMPITPLGAKMIINTKKKPMNSIQFSVSELSSSPRDEDDGPAQNRPHQGAHASSTDMRIKSPDRLQCSMPGDTKSW